MKLIDLINVIDDRCDVMVWAHNADMTKDILVTSYNEQEDIDPQFNDCIVEIITPYNGEGIDITLNLVVDEADYV